MKLAVVLFALVAVATAEYKGYHHKIGHIYDPQPYYYEQSPEVVHDNYHHSAHDDHDDYDESEHDVDYVGHPKYHYDYAVHDPHTHDQKNHWEHRDGKHVKGEYSVVQPDGKTRVVSYESHGHGTNYVVKYIHGHHY